MAAPNSKVVLEWIAQANTNLTKEVIQAGFQKCHWTSKDGIDLGTNDTEQIAGVDVDELVFRLNELGMIEGVDTYDNDFFRQEDESDDSDVNGLFETIPIVYE